MTSGWAWRLQQGIEGCKASFIWSPQGWVVCNIPLSSDILGL